MGTFYIATTGGILGVEEDSQLLKEHNAVSLGELDPPKVLNLMDEYLKKILSAREEGRKRKPATIPSPLFTISYIVALKSFA